jgi:hypothetical protein
LRGAHSATIGFRCDLRILGNTELWGIEIWSGDAIAAANASGRKIAITR